MYIVNSYTLAIIFCFITMICWGSWGNTQKLASKNWRYELYYWDYTIGILLFALLLVFTLGSFGDSGRGFLEDIQQVEAAYIASALIGGAIFNASNILLSASVSIAGMAVAFPLGVGLALVLGVFILKSATKLFSVLLASKRPLITELADKLRLKYPLLPTISPCPTMRLEAIRSIIPISCRRYPKSV